jgi:AcrR family transcriptional regulator
MTTPRAHTGRRRNDATRRAVLEAALSLLATGVPLSVERLAETAGVGKQTIYRWWPTKAAVVVEAMKEAAQLRIPERDTGSLSGDLQHFLVEMFSAAREPVVAGALRTLAAESVSTPIAAEILRAYAADRRRVFKALIDRAATRGEIGRPPKDELAAEQAFGVVWYRLLISGATTDDRSARRLARVLARQLGQLPAGSA